MQQSSDTIPGPPHVMTQRRFALDLAQRLDNIGGEILPDDILGQLILGRRDTGMSEGLFALNANADLGAECVRLDRAWRNFVELKHQPPNVRPIIWESWNRCAHVGLDALGSKSPRVLSEDEVRDYVENDPVFAAARLALPALSAAAVDSGHMLVYCDAAGHIVHLTGEASVRRRADRMNFVVGSHWAEDHAGTNAIGTAIITGEPVQLIGSEHYCHAVHNWTCSASPIRDPANNSVLAVIDMTGLRERFHPHTLVSVMAVTQLIEERLRGKLEADRYRLLEHYADQTTRSPQVPLVVLDRGGRVVKASPILHRHGWIDDKCRLVGSSPTALTSGAESTWDVEASGGKWSFVLTPCLDRGRFVGAVVQVVRDGGALFSRQSGGSPTAHHSDDLHSFDSLIGKAEAFRRALAVAKSAGSTLPVLIEGETGTGKELVAQAIHFASARRAKPFVAVNCGALTRELATSEFFGYEGGSFTGAAREGRIGKFEQANGGTLFLDEIGDLPLELQALLLRVLDDCKIVHVGGRKVIAVDVRIIAATNHDLLSCTERGAFRRDLYYRLNVIRVPMPALKDRLADLPLLFRHYCERAFSRLGRPVPELTPEVHHILQSHSWPGNVRQLRNLAEWLAANTTQTIINADDLPAEFRQKPGHQAGRGNHAGGSLRAQELEAIRSMLEECGGNVSDAAHRLCINRSTIYRKLGRGSGSG